MKPLSVATYDYKKQKGERISLDPKSGKRLPSKTVPDQTMTPREIMKRFVTGRGIPAQNPGIYSEEDAPDMRKMDIADQYNYGLYTQERAKESDEKAKQEGEDNRTKKKIEAEKLKQKDQINKDTVGKQPEDEK